MDDSFRISSNDNKVPDLSIKKTNDKVINDIRSMDPPTAFIAVKTVVLPTLSKLAAPPMEDTSQPSPMELSLAMQSQGSTFKELTNNLDLIQSDLKDLQTRIRESEKNTKKSIDRDLLEKRVASLQEKIALLEKKLPKNPLIKTLNKTVKELLDTLPKINGKNNKATRKSKNFLQSVENKKNLNNSLIGIDKSLKDIYAFSSSKEYHIEKLKSLNSGAAYAYAVSVFLPYLQSQSAQTLEEKGKTMKQISKLYDKWNEIQEEINDMSKNIKELFKNQVIKDQKVNFWNIITYKKHKVGKFNDPKHIFAGLLQSKDKIEEKLKEFQKLLKQVEKKLPSSAHSLIETLKELAFKLQLNQTVDDFHFYYWNENEMRFEILAKDANLKDNNDTNKMNELLMDRLERVYGFFISEDQTQFKAYMDNIAQGITALTSISNMTQQEVQIASQYYNSLLGLQKNGFDSINKVIQIAIKPPSN